MPVAIDDLPWSGPPQFVVGLDIGTTHSSVTFSHLQPNLKPVNDRVTHWPSRTGMGGSSDAKTSSMLYYDSNNQVKAAGAAVATPAMRFAASKNGWHLIRYFKLQMHPPEMIQDQKFVHIEGLPRGLTVEKVYADMIRYLMDHTRDFFNQRNGQGKWEQLRPIMKLVVAHPNGWGLREQERLRQAVVLSGIMDNHDVQRRVQFVPEAEAAVHYVLWEKSQELTPGDEFVVCDVGGSTVDTTTYRVLHEYEATAELGFNAVAKKEGLLHRMFRSSSSKDSVSHRRSTIYPPLATVKAPIRLKELKASDCQPAGGVLVNEAFIEHLKSQFFLLPPQHPYNLEMCVQKAEESFELNCKREFRTSSDAPLEYVVDMSTGIQELGYPDGSIVLDPSVVQGFFDDAVRLILGSVRKQLNGTKAKYIFLVGGFGASQYLRQRVTTEFQRDSLQVLFLDDAHGKAASDGSIIWFVRQGVVGRAARMSFGLQIVVPHDPSLAEHRIRDQVLLPNGTYHVKGKWDLIVEKDKVVDQQLALRRPYSRTYSSSHPNLGHFIVELYAWSSDRQSPPQWVTDADGNVIEGFGVVCEITADMSGMAGSLKKYKGQNGQYWKLDFELCLEFGGVELKAFLEWKEKQKMVKRSDAKILIT